LLIMATRTEPGGMCQHTFDNVGILYSTCAAVAVLRGWPRRFSAEGFEVVQNWFGKTSGWRSHRRARPL